jgi:uncharacterized RDD family membrane protein YckC
VSDFNPPSNRQGPRADTGARFVAYIIDIVILLVVTFVLAAILKDAGSGISFLIGLAYFIYFDGSASGQTIGKRAMNIRVIDFQTGAALGYGKAFIRYIGRFISGIACGLGYFWAIWDEQHQGWHDKIAGTVVVPVADYPVSTWP